MPIGYLTPSAALGQWLAPGASSKTEMTRFILLVCVCLLLGCGSNVYVAAPGLEANPDLLGPNISEEIERGAFYVGPGDKVAVDIWNHADLNRTYEVDEDGNVFMHLIREIPVAGMTRTELRQLLYEEYSRFLVDPSLDVGIESSLDRKVTVLGQVARPGVYPLSTPRTTILDMVAQAGGVDAEGDATGILLARNMEGQVRVASFDMNMLFDPPDLQTRSQIPFVKNGDTLYVLRTWEAEYGDTLRLVSDSLRAITFGERAIQLAPRTSAALRNDN